MQNRMHLLNYRQIHAKLRTQLDRGSTRFHSLRHHRHRTGDVPDCPPLRQLQCLPAGSGSVPRCKSVLDLPVRRARPDVFGSPPIATAKRLISASPLVMSAASVLFPNPRPWQTPAPIAMTFFSAAPTSTPIGSLIGIQT